MDHNNYLLAVSVLRILTEFAILLTPIRSIWSLHMKVERKIAMVLLLGAGILYVKPMHRFKSVYKKTNNL